MGSNTTAWAGRMASHLLAKEGRRPPLASFLCDEVLQAFRLVYTTPSRAWTLPFQGTHIACISCLRLQQLLTSTALVLFAASFFFHHPSLGFYPDIFTTSIFHLGEKTTALKFEPRYHFLCCHWFAEPPLRGKLRSHIGSPEVPIRLRMIYILPLFSNCGSLSLPSVGLLVSYVAFLLP
jgi:hypothetical protein